MLIYGIHPITEALRAGSVSEMWISTRQNRRLDPLVDTVRRAGATVRRVENAELDRLAHGGVHQGVVARVASLAARSVTELVRDADGPPLFLVVDGVEDPQNFGALVRTAEAVSIDGVVFQTRRASPASAAAMKASAGALAHVPLAPVVNISRAISELKTAGVWAVGLEAGERQPYYDLDFRQPTALVVGSEGTGIRRLVRDRCDWLVSIPMRGEVSSLNVSVAAGVVLYEALRQRSAQPPGGRSIQ